MARIKATSTKALIVVLYPYLSQYAIGSTGVDIGTITIIALLVGSLGRARRSEGKWLLLCIYCVMTTMISSDLGWMTEISPITSAVRLIKMLVAFLYVSLSKDDIDEFSLKKYYYMIGDIATYAVFLQTVLYYTMHIGLKLNHGVQLFAATTSRPCSIFNEPSQYTNFMVVLLAMTFFKDQDDVYYKDRKILYSIGILFSTSGQGYVILAGMWMMYILYKGVLLHQFGRAMGYAVALLAALAIVSQIPIVQQSYARFFSSTSETGYSSAVTGRLVGFDYINELSREQFLIGTGFGNRVSGKAVTGGVIYYNGISSIISGSGIIGLGLYAWICLGYMRKTSFAYIAAILVIWGLMFSANLFYAPYIVLYFTVIKKCGIESRYKNSIVAAGSVVTKSIPTNEVCGGNPARKIKDV